MSEHEQSSPNWPILNSEHVPPMWFFTSKDKEAEEANERNTHFQGWARDLREKIIKACTKQVNALDDILLYDEEFFTQELDVLIAQAGYDLVKYVMENTKSGTLETAHFYFDDTVSDIPDMTARPEQSE